MGRFQTHRDSRHRDILCEDTYTCTQTKTNTHMQKWGCIQLDGKRGTSQLWGPGWLTGSRESMLKEVKPISPPGNSGLWLQNIWPHARSISYIQCLFTVLGFVLETLYTQSCFVKAMFTNTPPQRGITHLVDVLQPTLDTYLKSFLFVLSLPSYIRKYEQYRQKEIKQLKLKNCSTDCGKTMFFSNQVYIWTCKCCCFFGYLCMSAFEKWHLSEWQGSHIFWPIHF